MTVEFMKESIIRMLDDACAERIEFIFWFLQKATTE